jgi:cytochrome c553
VSTLIEAWAFKGVRSMKSFPLILVAGAVFVTGGVASHAGDVAAGREKAKACSVCHGMDGLSLATDAPHIAGQSEVYMRSQLENYRSQQRIHSQMNIIAGNLSDDDIADLVAYYSGIKLEAHVPR